MNPKEKAKELVGKYVKFKRDGKFHIFGLELSKQFALIAVDELIDNCENVFDADYWKEVRQEIELV